MFKKTIDFLLHGVWRIKVANLNSWKAFVIRTLRFFILIIRGFTKEELQEKASVLSYYTILSLVPIIAILIAITRSFFLEDAFTQMLIQQFPAQGELIHKVITIGKQALEATSHSTIAGIGVLIFFWSTFKIINHLENGLNEIFHAKSHSSLLRRFSEYIGVIFLSPLFLAISTAISIYISSEISFFTKEHFFSKETGIILYFFLNILSYFIISFLFTFLYLFLSNTKIEFFSALIGGLIAGLIYQIFQVVYFNTQILLSKANPILGTVSILPLLLIWMQLSWLILLLGAKITISIQNIDAYEFMVENFTLKQKTKNLLSLLVTHYCVKQFCLSLPAPSARKISDDLSLPLFLIVNILDDLEKCGILVEVKNLKDKDLGYHPASNVENLTIKRVLDMINENGDEIPLPATADAKIVQKSLQTFSHLIAHSKANILLKNI